MKVTSISKPETAEQILLMLKSELAANRNDFEKMQDRRDKLPSEQQYFLNGFEEAIKAVENYIANRERDQA